MDITSLCNDNFHLIFSMADNHRCILVCKSWQKTIMLKSIKCNTCNKITNIYDADLWVSDDNDKCHNYSCSVEDFKKLNALFTLSSINIKVEILKQIKRLVNKTEYMTSKIIHNDGNMIQYVDNKTEKLCLEAIRQNENLLIYFNYNEQTEKIRLQAVKQNGLTLKYIVEQTELICLEAVKQNGFALQYVTIQTEKICLEAVKQNIHAKQFINIVTENIALILDWPLAAKAA